MSQIVVSKSSGLELSFVPEMYQKEFITSILGTYEVDAQYVMKIDEHIRTTVIPDVADLIAVNGEFFISAALAKETGDPEALDKRLRDFETDEERMDFIADLHDDFSHHGFEDYHWEYLDDITAVLHYYQMSFFASHAVSFLNPSHRIYEMHNYPIIEVW